MTKTRGLLVAVLGLMFCQLTTAPAAALCTAVCGGTPECPQCEFSAFRGYLCFGNCRWCAEFECHVALPPGELGDEIAMLLAGGPAASARCPAAGVVAQEPAGASGPVRVTELQARL